MAVGSHNAVPEWSLFSIRGVLSQRYFPHIFLQAQNQLSCEDGKQWQDHHVDILMDGPSA